MSQDQADLAGIGGERNELGTLRTLLPYLWPSARAELRVRVLLALGCLVAAKLANVAVPVFYRDAVDALNVETGAVIALPIALILAYGLTRLMTQVFGELRDALFARVGQHAIRTVALHTFQHLHNLSLRFHLDRQTGGLSRVIERGVKGIEFLLNFMLFNILPTLLEIFLVCGILWSLFDIWFALVTFGTIATYIAYTLIVTEWRLKYRRAMNQKDEEANTKAIDSLLNFETVKYFNNEAHEASRFESAMRGYEDAAVKSIMSLSAVNIGQGLIISAGLVSLMAMAGLGVVAGTMSVGDFVLVNTYLVQLYLPLNFLGFVYRQIRQSLTDMDKMFRILDIRTDVANRPNAGELGLDRGTVTFDKVCFGYDPRRPILKDVSFTAHPGETVAIVGPTGAGKSTISRLLFRFYDVTDGTISIDGQDVRTLTQQSVRRAIGIVPQDTVLFNDTIFYNIAYGRPGASPAEIEEAARHARIHDFIMALPDGYQTRVGERGLKLSGGEKQRVAIARTILKKPQILLFDEATSALDTATEREIQKSLREVSAGHTTLVIAHRLSTVVDADEIIVLDEGRIVERGKHAALLEHEGTYAKMWTRQQEAQQVEGPVPPPSLEPDAAD